MNSPPSPSPAHMKINVRSLVRSSGDPKGRLVLVRAPIFELDRHARVGGLEVLDDRFVGLGDRWIVEA